MELMLRCALPDRPGSLARVASALGEVGVDIEAVEVIDVADGRAIDDMVVVVDEPHRVQRLLDRLDELEDVEVIHSGPSRGHPGDAVARAAVGLEALLDGSSAPDDGVTTLVGGLLRAHTAEIVASAPASARPTRLVLAVGERWLVLTRPYPFTATERQRGEALARAASAACASRSGPSVAS